jgi:hypothetical protein
MADPTVTYNVSTSDRSVVMVTWVLTTADAEGTPFEGPEWADRTWQFGKTGDTLGGADGMIVGSHFATPLADFAQLSNAVGGVPIAFNALGSVKTVVELSRFMRPRLGTTGAGASITVVMLARRANPMRT